MSAIRKKSCSGKSAGIVVNKEGKILLIDRAIFPFGWACPAGHIDEGELPEETVRRELEEETGLVVNSSKLVFEEKMVPNQCSRGTGFHDWYVFEGDVSGDLRIAEREVKNVGWFEIKEIKGLTLEPIWEKWFKKLKVI
ncbi:MAG: NUDIX hydrolase [Candidatus Nealsonbacteria bacterium]|nr:NUDIX hydrolase [Candidatus Nealsonbacteria bacterium]